MTESKNWLEKNVFFILRKTENMFFHPPIYDLIYEEFKKKIHLLVGKLKKDTFITQKFSALILKSVGGHGITKLC